MSNARTRLIDLTKLADLPSAGYDGPGERLLRVDLYFLDRRGYYASANVIEERQCDGYKTQACMPFSAAVQMIEQSSRFNAKRLAAISVPQDILDTIKAKALANNERRGA